jgi:phage tail sheath protein FI
VTYLAPGVFIEEVPSGPQPIAAAPTSVVAIVGTTQKGPYMEPTRVTGWGQYIELFGGSDTRGFTAESAFGFFENGGPAAYVVRVDPSVSAEWIVNDRDGNEAFRIEASSAGAWANDLQVSVAPDETGGSGLLYSGRVTGAVNVAGNGVTNVQVESTVGLSAGDAVMLVPAAGTAAEATVDTIVSATTVAINKGTAGAVALAAGDRVAGLADGAATSLRLAAANGIRQGDLLVAELPDRSRVTSTVATAVNEGAGMVLTLTAGLGSDVPGAQFAARVDRFRGTIGALTNPFFALGAVTWDDEPAVRPLPADVLSNNFRAFASNGLQGSWASGNTRFEFPVIPPAGTVEVEAAVSVRRYGEVVALSNPTLDALATQFGFLPENTQLELKRTGSATTTAVTRTATGFSVGNAADLNNDFESVRFLLPNNASNGVVVRCARDVRVDDFVDFGGGNVLRVTDVTRPGGTIQVLDFAVNTNISAAAGDRWVVRAIESTRVYPLRFELGVSSGGTPVESFKSLALDPANPLYYFKEGTINGTATTIRVTERAAGPIDDGSLPVSTQVSRAGSDVAAQPSDFRSGFTTLEAEPEPAMVICPETTSLDDPLIAADVIGAMVTHCQTFRRLAVVDSPDLANDQELVDWRNQTVASTYASVYAPHVKIVSLNPDSIERFALVPPSGFVTGVMARVDRTPPGVAKAPANEQVMGIVGVSQTYTHRRQELLNPNAVNLIRAFPGRGIRIWGARNATDDVQFRYTNVRRLFNAIETSVERGTQWVVFEPNTASTWLRVKVSVEGFLEQRWRAGELAGSTPDEAFRVRVGLGETMSEDQVDLGLVIVEVAIAPAKPAEFVVFRFSHKRLSD